MSSKPRVLHVDDDPDELRAWADEVRSQATVELEICHPDAITDDSLRKAALVLVDFRLERWPERANTKSLALKPVNGLALLSVLQEAELDSMDSGPARAFALYTAVIQDVARGLSRQPHIVARAHNLEWVFEKNGAGNGLATRAARVAELASAVSALPSKWPGETSDSAALALHTWLGLRSDVPWHDAAWREVRRCRPPVHEFAEHTQGIGVLRWALHRVLPYPTFLVDDAHLAARLRVSLDSLRASIDSVEFRALFGAAEYQGQLALFSGRRWWRGGIEAVIFDLTADNPGNLSALHSILSVRVPSLSLSNEPRLYPVLDRQFRVKEKLATEAEVVEVIPDDWPPFADEAWALRADLADSPELKAVANDEES